MKLKLYFIMVIGWLLFIFIASNNLEDNQLKINVQEYALANGLKILMVEDHSAPVVVFRGNVNVGSVHEGLGYTGGAHFLEHMMFKGTEIFGTKNFEKERELFLREDALVKKIREGAAEEYKKELAELREGLDEVKVMNDFWSITEKEGFVGNNAFTNYDRTCYMYSIPSNKLEMLFFIESDRMRNLALREFYTEIGAVLEERRMRLENSPSGLLRQKTMELVFEGTPYSRMVIGDPADISNFTRDQVMEYYRTYYVPNNMTFVLVGDINPEKVIELAERYFGSMTKREVEELDNSLFISPEQTEEKRAYINYPSSSKAVIGYRTVSAGHEDTFVLDFISEILSRGRTSKFYKFLTEKSIVSSVGSYNSSMKYGGFFNISFAPAAGHSIDEIEKVVYGEIDKLKNGQISEQEMSKIRKLWKIDCLRISESLSSLADNVSYYETICGDWEVFNNILPEIDNITVDDIVRVANKYFVPENRSVVILRNNKGGNKNE